MDLNKAIKQRMNESRLQLSLFINLKDIYVHLQNGSPQASTIDILDVFCSAYEHLAIKPVLYQLSGGHLRKVDVYARVMPSKLSAFEEIGKYIPVTLSRLIAEVKNDPLTHQSAKEYGFIRDEINQALSMDFPEIPSELHDYEVENLGLKKQIAELQDVIRQMEPSPHAERHATKKVDILSALLSLLYRPDFYVDIEDMQRKIKSGVPVLDLIRNALPSQTRLAELLDEKSPLFWPKTGKPPLALRTVESHISKAINRIKKAK